MQIEKKIVDGVVVLSLIGRISLGEGTMALRNSVREALTSAPSAKIVLNIAEVNYIDGSGIGELVSSYTRVSNQSGELALSNVAPKIEDLLKITKLFHVFRVFKDETHAIAALR